MKFTTKHTEFFKIWTAGNLRIVNDIHAKVFYHYEVQRFDGTCWIKVRSFHTLAEAKKAVIWMAEDEAMEASRMA